jgi:Protein of unknown function (DUF3467)
MVDPQFFDRESFGTNTNPMSDLTNNPIGGPGGNEGGGAGGDKPQPIAHSPVSARVPERLSRGVPATGYLIAQSPKEILIDFVQAITRPQQVVARVVMSPVTAGEFANALQQNVDIFQTNHGPLPAAAAAPQQPQQNVREIYEQLKVSEEVHGGAYCNAVLISHSATEFCFDFITTFFPTSMVTSRVFLSAPNLPRFLSSLKQTHQQWNLGQRPPGA